MRLAKIGLGTLMAAAALAVPAPAQAQEEPICIPDVGTLVKGTCIPVDELCAGRVCVDGVWENVEWLRGIVEELPPKVIELVEDLVPMKLCTPTLPSGSPICIST